MEITDVQKQKIARETRYRGALALADDVFGADRILADGRGYAGTRNGFYVDGLIDGSRITSNIEIKLTENTAVITVNDERHLQEAKNYGEKFEKRFCGSFVTLEHNLK